MKETKSWFPLFVNLDQVRILVVGGGNIAKRRILGLTEFGGMLTVLSPFLDGELLPLARDGRISWKNGRYAGAPGTDSGSFLDGMDLVLAATDDPKVNAAVYEDCRRKGIPVNCADDRNRCDFYFPALVRKDDLVIGISSGGKDHSKVRQTAAKLRTFLEEEGPDR